MDPTVPEWDEAEKDFILKRQQIRVENKKILSEVISASFLVFRRQQKTWLKSFCEKSLEYIKGKGFLEQNDYLQPSVNISFSLTSPRETQGERRPVFDAHFCSLEEPGEKYLSDRIRVENERIINGILLGNQKIFNEIYEYEFPKVVRYVKSNSGDADQAKDIFQDAIVILVEKVQRKELDLTCSIKTYLFSISQHLWMEQLRLVKKNIPFDKNSSQIPFDISVISFDTIPDIYDEVNKAIDQLNNNGKTILECFYYKKMSCEEIAQLLGYSSAASVRNQKYKYLEQIRRAVNLELYADRF